MDGSRSLVEEDWKTIKNVLKNLCNLLPTLLDSSNSIKIELVQYSSDGVIEYKNDSLQLKSSPQVVLKEQEHSIILNGTNMK